MVNSASFIRTLREKLDLTQKEFALLVGVTSSVVSRWENDHSNPVKRRWELLHDVNQKLNREHSDQLERVKLRLLMGAMLPIEDTAFELYNDDRLVDVLKDHVQQQQLLNRQRA